MEIDDETLMAYADGELEPETALQVEQAIAADPRLGERLDVFVSSRLAVKKAFKATEETVPQALEAKVRAVAAATDNTRETDVPPDKADANVVPMALPRSRRAVGRAQMAIAASVALLLGLGAGWFGAAGFRSDDSKLAGLDRPLVGEVLSRLPSGKREVLGDGTEISAIASFRGQGGKFCREFEYSAKSRDAIIAVACAKQGAWDIRLAVATRPAGAQGYTPASSPEVMDAYLRAIQAGEPLEPEDEASALKTLR